MMKDQTDHIYYEDIVETIREPLLVLDSDLMVLSANRCFYDTFKVTPKKAIGRLIYDLGNRQWDIPQLRTLLEEILPKEKKFNNYEVEHVFPNIGHKIMLLNARRITHKGIGSQLISGHRRHHGTQATGRHIRRKRYCRTQAGGGNSAGK